MITDEKRIVQLLGTTDESVANLDRFAIEREDGGIQAILAMSTRFFFEDGQLEPRRRKAIDGVARYCTEFSNRLTHHISHEGRAIPYSQEETLNHFRATASLDDPDEHTLFLSVVGFPGGKPTRRPLDTECRISAAMPYWAQFEVYSEWAATTTFAALGTNYRKALMSNVIDWANAVQPCHGTAGPSLRVDNSFNHQRPGATILPLLNRFPGLDYDDGGAWITEAALSQKIRSINWLILLNDSFVELLGGVGAMREALGRDCPIHAYKHGVIIQAGPHPVIGDASQGVISEHYRKVANVIMPIRFEDYTLGLLYPPEPLHRAEETVSWVRRFD